MNSIINSAIKSQKQLEKLPTHQVAEALFQISNSIKNKREELALLIVEEAKKPLKYALGEVDRAAQTFLIASEECKRNQGEYISIDWTPKGEGKQAILKRFPVGVVLGITPFNFPLNLVAHKVAPALASRNSIIIKPSPRTPKCAYALLEIVNQTDLPKNSLHVVEWNNDETMKAVAHEYINFVSFTGSDKVGWKIKEQAKKSKVTLELGGNAGVIITPTANLTEAIDKTIVGAFAYSGQVCIHTQQVFVHEDIYKEFTQQFLAKTRQLISQGLTNPNSDFGPLIDEENAIRVQEWIQEATEKGAKLLAGGTREHDFVAPTILEHTSTDMKVISQEVFGPVVSFISYKKLEDPINQLNKSDFGLQTGIFTDSQQEINQAFSELKVGGVIVNDTPTFRVDHMPYGGEKNSGFGREGVKYAMEEMSYLKTLVF